MYFFTTNADHKGRYIHKDGAPDDIWDHKDPAKKFSIKLDSTVADKNMWVVVDTDDSDAKKYEAEISSLFPISRIEGGNTFLWHDSADKTTPDYVRYSGKSG